MNAILTLLAVSAFVGVVLGHYFSWRMILASGMMLAVASALVSQHQSLGVFFSE
jgi:hypothetical protein